MKKNKIDKKKQKPKRGKNYIFSKTLGYVCKKDYDLKDKGE